jgi:membrane associated rhomboid family serine protease
MQEPTAPCTIALIILTSLCSIKGFRTPAFCQRNLFSVREVLVGKEYYRLFTSAFLHADWNHLLLNMFSLYLFGRQIELYLGVGKFLLIYFTAVLGGDLLSLWIHRQHEYRAYGASGGVCGLIFSFILLFPDSGISMFMLPFWIPGWLYAVLYLAGSFLALKSQAGNIGHDAHIGGALVGLWTTAALEPGLMRQHLNLFLAISGIALLLFFYLVKNPLFLPLWSFLPASPQQKSESAKPQRRKNESFEVDAILEKISKTGIDSLSPEERTFLSSVSEKYKRRSESQKPQSDLII